MPERREGGEYSGNGENGSPGDDKSSAVNSNSRSGDADDSSSTNDSNNNRSTTADGITSQDHHRPSPSVHTTFVLPAALSTAIAARAVDIVVCSDCCYSTAAVLPLLDALQEVCTVGHTVVVMANEQRSALDSFITTARRLEGFCMYYRFGSDFFQLRIC